MNKPKRLFIPLIEFYITNVCNLSCPGCNRFNNHRFRGYQKWNDYADIYSRWAQEVNLGSISILGGEPLLNPTVMDWFQGIHKLWPNAECKIVTNAFHLNKVKGLYDILLSDPKLSIEVGIHNKAHKPMIVREVENFLTAPLTHEFNNDDNQRPFLTITDSNGIKIKIEYNWWFHQGTLISTADGFSLHQSDPEKAHKNCHMSLCHHFIRGKLYKCGVVAVLPEFSEQHKIILTDEDRSLMLGYQPLTIDHNRQDKEKFIANLPNTIDQCRFCPEQYSGDIIAAQEKKVIFMESN